MKRASVSDWLPQFDRAIWILAGGRLLSQVGSGFTFIYLPIFFVNQVGLSATAVGLGLGSASISGVVGRLVSGSMTDSRFWGRRKTLLLSAVVSAIAVFVLAAANDFPTFVAGNLIVGLGLGLYWPSSEAIIADLTTAQQRNEAYAINRLADSLGLGLGIVLGGLLVAAAGAYRTLFVIDGVSFLVFMGIAYWGIPESFQAHEQGQPGLQGWRVALQDYRLGVYVLVNILFTTYLAQINSALPLYFNNFAERGEGFSSAMISGLFTWHLSLSVLTQMPVARWLSRWSHAQALSISALFWAIGFLLVGLTGVASSFSLIWAVLALLILAIATVSYTPAASSLVADLAPPAYRGVYLSINSLCWAIGYFIGPPLGGWALDQPRPLVDLYWAGLALSIIVTLLILRYLHRLLVKAPQEHRLKSP